MVWASGCRIERSRVLQEGGGPPCLAVPRGLTLGQWRTRPAFRASSAAKSWGSRPSRCRTHSERAGGPDARGHTALPTRSVRSGGALGTHTGRAGTPTA